MFDSPVFSSIAADDMGLGKTLTMISLIVKDSENPRGQRLYDRGEFFFFQLWIVVFDMQVT